MKYFIVLFFLSVSQTALSQNEGAVHWLTFEQLEDSLKVKPKKVFIEFYADWCAPCLRMQKEVFNESEIINKLNKDYFAVKMNVETTDTITFGNQVFVNERKNRRNPVHQIPLLMALQKNKPFSLPALVFMDKNFKATARYFQYLNKEQFFKIISE
ncbi:thioredoxin family protein [Arenibacter sp. M-2]|uniref:thioredoxin family protein n=1 Tax=Arenibacter sp. M-2 TaxID=3053612 RepID=UPI002570F27F|nr:thioredoxin family protein [Arenibacter sp. M-2]MDL5512456.1 thioredoxin family protein [Arenibacter sp. M-2]